MKHSPFIKKITAAILLFLFGYILAEKAVHSHEMLHKEFAHHTFVQKDTGCKICDFQLLPEADFASPADCTQIVLYLPLYTENGSEGFAAKPVIIHAERGPPSLG